MYRTLVICREFGVGAMHRAPTPIPPQIEMGSTQPRCSAPYNGCEITRSQALY